MTPRRLSLGLIAVLGSYVAHEFGYGVAGLFARQSGELAHDYVASVATFAVPAGVAALALLIVRSEAVPVDSFRWSTVALLSGAQMALFATQEVVEALIGGDPVAGLMQPAIAIGLLLQPLAAWLLLTTAVAGRHLVELIEGSAAPGRQRSSGPALVPAALAAPGFSNHERSPRHLRGPPVAPIA